jgi:hypothetical protein
MVKDTMDQPNSILVVNCGAFSHSQTLIGTTGANGMEKPVLELHPYSISFKHKPPYPKPISKQLYSPHNSNSACQPD